MRTWSLRLAGIVLFLTALAPSTGYAQPGLGYALPDSGLLSPFYSTRPEEGFFFAGSYVMYKQRVPLRSQFVAARGIFDLEGAISGLQGTFLGTATQALDTGSVRGPGTFQPGFAVDFGWRFRDGSALTFNWMHLTKAQYSSVATLLPTNFVVGRGLSDTFLFSPVTNFPIEFAGPDVDVQDFNGNTVAAFGVWNGADLMTLEFVQRNEQIELTYRQPIYETETWRTYGLIGPRFVWFWERFKWRTTDLDLAGASLPVWEAIYSNTVSNRMYGVKIGIGNEKYLGHGFAVSLDLQAALFGNIVKERVKYERGDRNAGPERKRSRTDYTIVPELQATANLFWYPMEGIQLKLGYDVQTFFNTVGSRYPISFDYSGVDPGFDRVFRWLSGFQVGLAVNF